MHDICWNENPYSVLIWSRKSTGQFATIIRTSFPQTHLKKNAIPFFFCIICSFFRVIQFIIIIFLFSRRVSIFILYALSLPSSHLFLFSHDSFGFLTQLSSSLDFFLISFVNPSSTSLSSSFSVTLSFIEANFQFRLLSDCPFRQILLAPLAYPRYKTAYPNLKQLHPSFLRRKKMTSLKQKNKYKKARNPLNLETRRPRAKRKNSLKTLIIRKKNKIK